jgi:hypothetical protein
MRLYAPGDNQARGGPRPRSDPSLPLRRCTGHRRPPLLPVRRSSAAVAIGFAQKERSRSPGHAPALPLDELRRGTTPSVISGGEGVVSGEDRAGLGEQRKLCWAR